MVDRNNQDGNPARPPQVFDRRLLVARRTRAVALNARALNARDRMSGGEGRPEAEPASRELSVPDFLLDWVAEDFAARLSVITRTFQRGLNLGAHNGRLSRALRQNQRGLAFVDLDPCAAMLRHCSGPCVLADEEALPFADGSFDLVVSGLALHWVNDLPGALVQVRRVLQPDGLFLGALLGGATLGELRTALAQAEAEVCGGMSPRVAPFADVRDLGSLLQRAGFALPVTDVDPVTVTYDTAFALMQELRLMGATNVLIDRHRVPPPRALFLRAAEIYADRFADADGRVRATFEIVTLTAWAPGPGQQQPLRPGSATTRLADALGTTERPAGDKP